MRRVTWRNLLARKVRLLLSAFAIVLGVAFVGGSLIFTDALGGAFDDIVEGSTADVEVAYQGANDFDSQQDSRVLPASVVRDLEGVPGVGSVHPNISVQNVYVIGDDGKVVGGNGPPGLAFNWTTARSVSGGPVMQLVEGALPDGPRQVALDTDSAEKAGKAVGDQVDLVTPGDDPELTATVTGLVKFGTGGLNGATLSIFDTGWLQDRFFGGRDVFSSVSLNTADGVSQRRLADAAQQVLPQGVTARTGDAMVQENKKTIDQVLGFLQTFLLVFAAVSLVVGTFLIINTFSILVAQRSRELALLRALGASRGQVNRSVLLEAVVVGLIGSTVGLGVGYLLAQGLRWVFGLLGLDLAGAEFPVQLSTVVACYAVGVVVTVVAAYLPARRAARIAPVAALRDDVALPEQTLRRRSLGALVLVAGGVAAMVSGFRHDGGGNTALSLIGVGMLLVVVGAALLSPVLARPVLRLFGVPYRAAFRSVGRLATENAVRNPRRTAATASALMVGLALVTMMSMLGSSASASTDAAVKQNLTSQFVVSNVVGSSFSTRIAAEMRQVDGVRSVAAVRQAFPEVDGDGVFVAAVRPADLGLALALPMAQGSLLALGPGTVAVTQQVADSRDLGLGDRVQMRFQGGTVPLRVAAVLADGGAAPASWLVTPDTFRKGGLAPLDSLLFVTKEPGADTDTVRAALEKITADLPTVTVKDPEGFAQEQKSQINLFLNLIYGLLGLSVVIAVLGVVNTLGLSVIERTREVGLLRAVGLSRRQLRTMVRLEAVAVTVFGGLLGVGLGLAFGFALLRVLKDDGLTTTSVPWGLLVGVVVASGVVGVLAAVLPARRAARLDVLEAIATE